MKHSALGISAPENPSPEWLLRSVLNGAEQPEGHIPTQTLPIPRWGLSAGLKVKACPPGRQRSPATPQLPAAGGEDHFAPPWQGQECRR